MVTVKKHGLQFMYMQERLISIEGEWQNLQLREFHTTIISSINPRQAKMLVADIAHMQIDTGLVTLPTQEFDFSSEEEISSTGAIYQGYERLVQQYIQILRNFVTVNIDFDGSSEQYCQRCLFGLVKDEGFLVCHHCPTPTFKQISGTPTQHTNMLNIAHEMRNFRETLNFFEGHVGLSIAAFNAASRKLDTYFSTANGRAGAVVREDRNLKSGRKRETSRLIMTRALKAIRFEPRQNICSSNYVNLFMIRYWGWRRPDVSTIRNTIITNQIRLLGVLGPIIAAHGRKTNICHWIMLEEQLKQLGVKVHAQYFKVHKTEGVVDVHKEIMRKGFNVAGIM